MIIKTIKHTNIITITIRYIVDVELVVSLRIVVVGLFVLMVDDGLDVVVKIGFELVGSVRIVVVVGSVRIVVVVGFLLMVDDGLDVVVKIGLVLMYWIVANGFSSSEGISLVDVIDVFMLMFRCVNSIESLFVQLKNNGHTCWYIT